MIMRAVTVMGAIALLALASPTSAQCFKCVNPSWCGTCGEGTGTTAGCEVFQNGLCAEFPDGFQCTLPACSGGGGGGGPCMDPEICPIETQVVILLPGDEGASSPADRRGSGRTLSGLRGASFAVVLNRIRAESPGGAGLRLQGWHYAVGREAIRGGLVGDDGTGYAISARRTPAGTHVKLYQASSGRPLLPVSTSVLSPDEVMVFEQSMGGRAVLVVVGARGPGSGPAGSDVITRQVDFASALAALPQSGPVRWRSAREVATIPD